FTASAGAHTITLIGLNGTGDNTVFIDRLQVSSTDLSDPGFEETSVGAGQYRFAPPPKTVWSWRYSGTAGVAANGSAFTSGNPPAPDGVQVGFLQATGTMTLPITVAESGGYTVGGLLA